jgi:hypothetical protein
MGAGNSVKNTERSKALRWTQEKIGSRGDSIPKFLDEAVAAKSGKRYGAPCWLVVYLNISEYGIRQKETEAAISQVKARYASSFEAISVLWKGRLY